MQLWSYRKETTGLENDGGRVMDSRQ